MQLIVPLLMPASVCETDSDCEGRWHPADESSQIWHDWRHGHADAPQRGVCSVQPAQTLFCMDDLRESQKHYYPPCNWMKWINVASCFLRPTLDFSAWRWIHTNGCRCTRRPLWLPTKANVAPRRRRTSTLLQTMPIMTCCAVSVAIINDM